MSCKSEDLILSNLDQVALFTSKAIKRIVNSESQAWGSKMQQLQRLIQVVENNLATLQADRKVYFAAIRDYSRVFEDEWHDMIVQYNNMLVVVALKLGMEEMWSPNRCYPFMKSEVSEIAAALFTDTTPKFSLKELDQSESLFDYFAEHSPELEKISLPLSDNSSFMKIAKYKNLRVIELAGGVSDKVLCNALWNVGSKKSDKVLELALSKDPKSWQLSLPHLQVLKNILMRNDIEVGPMRVSLGAAALALQPKMDVVESKLAWGTFEAIYHLLDMEAKHKNGEKAKRKFEVTSLSMHYHKDLDIKAIEQVVKVCPKLSTLRLLHTKNIHSDISILTGILPVTQLKKLTLDASSLTDLEFTVLVASMKNLEHLTLWMTPASIVNYNLLKPPFKKKPGDTGKNRSMFPPIKTLVIEFMHEIGEFEIGDDPRKIEFPELNQPVTGDSEAIIHFLAVFDSATEVYFRNTLILNASFLVFGCIGGAIAVLPELRHVSVISTHEDVPSLGPPSCGFQNNHKSVAHIPNISHFLEVQKMLLELEEDVTFERLEKLTSFEIDEFYVSTAFDGLVKALRLSGVNVSVLYRKGMKY